MKIELPCAIVRDLLPSYAEGLTEEETAAAVKAHLDTCEDCRRKYEAMTELQVPADQAAEVDYLKSVRKHNIRKILAAVALTVAVAAGITCAKLFLIGSPSDGSSVAMTATVTPDKTALSLGLNELSSGSVLTGLKTETRDGVTRITGREVLVSPFHGPRTESVTLPLEGVERVEVFGRTVWQEGLVIEQKTDRLLAHKIPYVGDAPGLGQLISALELDFGCTMELQTGKQPYGVTLHFSEEIPENRRWMVESNAYLLLALVENLGEVSWDDPAGCADALTLKQADSSLPALAEESHAQLPQSVKDCAATAYDLQLLRNLLGI